MSSLGGMLGLSGGAAGTGFSAPTGVDPTQLTNAYNQTQQGIQQQQAFVNALAQQGGLQNQANVFQQLQNVAAGRGPNPAQAMLNQATGANTANQAALMAGQRGSAANPALIARQAAQQGAANQQQAAGQGATMQANQSLGALGQLGGLANTQVQQQQAGLQNLNQNSLQQQSNLLGLQSNINSANAGLAGNAQNQQSNMFGNIMGAAGAAMTMLAGGGEVQKYADGAAPVQAGSYAPIDPANDPFKAAPTALTSAPAPTGAIDMSTSAPASSPSKGPMSNVAKYFSSNKAPGAAPSIGSQNYFSSGQAGKDFGAGLAHMFGSSSASNAPTDSSSVFNQTPAQQESDRLNADLMLGDKNQTIMTSDNDQRMPFQAAHGGKVPALVSPGEVYLPPKKVEKVAKGKASAMDGEKIPGKPKVGGAKNSYANDTVPKTLEEGGIVIPRSITQGPNPHWNAMRFVHATIKKNRHSK